MHVQVAYIFVYATWHVLILTMKKKAKEMKQSEMDFSQHLGDIM